MPAPKAVVDLVDRFIRNRESYEDPQFNEAQTRIQFINPMFTALGWDVENHAGYAEAYKDVVHEDSLKIGAATKAPDYSFRIGGTRKFFVEAKKPSVVVRDMIDPAFQLRRYAWSAKLPLSVLTNFSALAVYDCRKKPSKDDRASTGRIHLWTVDDYVEKWDEIASVFSKEAVLQGSFDRYATGNRRGTAEVDDEFLAEIEQWREALAKNIASRNKGIETIHLNYAVQQTIDRIIFLRICEDRGIEPYGKLAQLRNGAQTYSALKELFIDADEKYNSGLFHFRAERGRKNEPDRITPQLVIDDKPLKDIVKRLYYPESPYEFSVLSADILGQVYEQFLGKVIVLSSGGRATVEEKPEVKHSGGVFYTPEFVVRYIVDKTLSPLLKGKTPTTAAGMSVVDPACGSGSFLLGAYDYLLNWYLHQYLQVGAAKHSKGKRPTLFLHKGKEWKLTTAERRRILLEHIFGVDIDAQAVEVTKLSLLLKVLETESAESLGKSFSMFHERALPDLEGNIKCGNSLIASDFHEHFEEDAESVGVNAFDWVAAFPGIFRRGGFDALIGNPPYDVLEKDRGESSWPHEALVKYVDIQQVYEAAKGGKLNLYRFFIVRSLNLVKADGRFGMIVPLSILADSSTAQTRAHLLRRTRDLQADCFPQKDNANRRIFKRAKLSTVVLTARVAGPRTVRNPTISVRTFPWSSFADRPKQSAITLADARLLDPETLPIPLVDSAELSLAKKLHGHPEVAPFSQIAGLSITRGEINQTVYRAFITSDAHKQRLLKGSELRRFGLNALATQGSRQWIDEVEFLRHHGEQASTHQRRIATQRITGVDDSYRLIASIIDPPCYFADSTNSVVVTDGCLYPIEYVLALLNSKMMQWRFRLSSTNNNVSTGQLKALPFRRLRSSDPHEQQLLKQIVRAVQTMLQLEEQRNSARTPAESAGLQRRVAALDANVDRLIFGLYGLTTADMELVESALVRPRGDDGRQDVREAA